MTKIEIKEMAGNYFLAPMDFLNIPSIMPILRFLSMENEFKEYDQCVNNNHSLN